MNYIIYFLLILFLTSCGSSGGSESGSYSAPTIKTSSANTLQADQFSLYQWYVKNNNLTQDEFGRTFNEFRTTLIQTNNLNLNRVYPRYIGYNNGNPIIVQVVDDGVDAYHEDLFHNMDFANSYNADVRVANSNNPTQYDFYNNSHGTQVAGIIGAVGYNNVGIKGIAPSSNIAGYAFRTIGTNGLDVTTTNLSRAWLTVGANPNSIAISNNSWGGCISNNEDWEDILEQGSNLLRDGKGRLYLFAAGNGRGQYSSCGRANYSESSNTSYFSNSQYSITVAAVSNSHRFASYSSYGANVIVSGYSGEPTLANIPTTNNTGTSNYYTETWREDTKRNYTYSFSGTSAATPVVSGVLALVLEACPDLTYRDVKYLLAKTSSRVDLGNSTWTRNSAGLWHSNDYGYGIVNAQKMISECSTHTSLGNKQTLNGASNGTDALSNTKVERTINIPRNINIEWLGLKLEINSDSMEDINIDIISPNGTKSNLLHFENHLGNSSIDDYDTIVKQAFIDGFRLSSQAFIDESSNGDWKVEVTSLKDTDAGTLNNISLEIVGY